MCATNHTCAPSPTSFPWQLALHAPDAIAHALGSNALGNGGNLQLVVLSACFTERLGEAIHTAGVPIVLAWSTKVTRREVK